MIWHGQEHGGNFGNSYKCLPEIDRADKVIHRSSEVLASSMPQNHHWVNFVPRYVVNCKF